MFCSISVTDNCTATHSPEVTCRFHLWCLSILSKSQARIALMLSLPTVRSSCCCLVFLYMTLSEQPQWANCRFEVDVLATAGHGLHAGGQFLDAANLCHRYSNYTLVCCDSEVFKNLSFFFFFFFCSCVRLHTSNLDYASLLQPVQFMSSSLDAGMWLLSDKVIHTYLAVLCYHKVPDVVLMLLQFIAHD